jgi:hypothetical protein
MLLLLMPLLLLVPVWTLLLTCCCAAAAITVATQEPENGTAKRRETSAERAKAKEDRLDAALKNLDAVLVPEAEQDGDSPRQAQDPTDGVTSPSSVRSLEGSDSPKNSMTSSADVFLERDAVLGFGRKTCIYMLFLALSMCTLVYAIVVAAMFWYIFHVAVESITFVLVVQSTFLVLVLAWGIRAAVRNNESGLNLYTFMLLMAVIMQFSIVMIVVVRGDEMVEFLESSAAAAQRQLCEDLEIEMNANITINENSTVAERAEAAGSALCSCDEGAATCVMNYMEKEYDVKPEQFQHAQIAAIMVQLLLAKLGWGMIVDLDYEEEQSIKKQAGGPPTGTLRGTMVRARDLMDTHSKRGRDPACVLELLTPDTAVKLHRKQQAQSKPCTDTLTPEWEEDFDQMVAYASSTELRVAVVDVSKPKKPVPMGEAILGLDGGNLNRGGAEEMSGEDIIEVDLFMTEKIKGAKKGEPKEKRIAAGTVDIKLLYVAVGGVKEKVAKSVTKSWYFEATVLFMVGVAMAILALQSPTAPPSDAMRGTLSLLEIFVATHMTIELLLELFAELSNGNLKAELRNPWMLLALYVCMCNWISIFQPVELKEHADGQAWSKLFSVSRIFRIVRPVRTLRMIRHIDIIVRIIATSAGILLTVCVLLLFLLLLYSLIGMSCFSGAIQYTCMDTALARTSVTGGEDAVVGTDLPVGCTDECDLYLPETLISRGILRNVEPLETDGEMISCPETLMCSLDALAVLPAGTEIVRCMRLGSGECFEAGFNNYTASEIEMEACQSLANPPEVGMDEFGFQDFDNIIRAVVTMFVQMTGDGGMHAMPQALYASGSGSAGAAWMIFFTASVFLNLLALNLFLAVCCSAYSDISSEMLEIDAKLKEQQKRRDEALQLDEQPEDTERREAEEADAALSLEERVDALDWQDRESRIAGCRNFSKRLILSQVFDMFISAIILANTVVMAFNHQGIDKDTADALGVIESIFLAVFIAEFLLKILGLGRKLYFAHAGNKFDFFVVFVCLIGYLAMMFNDQIIKYLEMMEVESGDSGAGMQALRAVRLLRALQLARLLHKQKALKVVLKTIFSAWKPICIHSLFCCFSVCMFAVMGMHILGGSLGCHVSLEDSPDGLCPEDELVALFRCSDCRKAAADDYPYESYETFLKGMLACFELTVGEEWSHVMYWYMAHAGGDSASMTSAIQLFFIAQYLWMNCILFSLFIAMLLENFNLTEDEKMPIQKKVWERRKRKALKHWRAGRGSLLIKTLDGEKSKGVAHTADDTMAEKLVHAAAVADLEDSHNKSLYLFTLDHPFRLRCAGIQGHPVFRNGIMALIMISCISLAIEGPKEGYVMQNFGVFFDSINLIVLGAFVFEALLKIVIHGFCYASGPSKPYLQTKMNRIDFIIIVLCVVAYLPFIGEQLQGGWAKSLRVVRVMTPLVNLTKNPEILLVVMSFLRSIPDTLVVMLPLFLMAVVFGVVGQEWFGGALGECHATCTAQTASRCVTLPVSEEIADIVPLSDDLLATLGNLQSCVDSGATWVSPMFNFDNALSGISLLFVALTDGVHEYMVDSTAALNGGASISFWIAFHLVFTCFFLNLFIGVLSASFSKSKGTATQTSRQRQWHAVKTTIAGFQPTVTNSEGQRPVATAMCCRRPVPHWWFRWRLMNFNAACNPRLEMFWRSVIMVNTFTLATDKFPASQVRDEVVTYLNLACLSLCTCEVVIKLTGYGPGSFFSSGWLISDFVLVVISWGLRLGQVRSGVEVLRVVRVFRLIALASKMPTLVALVESLVNCLRASMALIAISCVIIYLYSVIGMNLFGSVEIDADKDYLNDYNNFSNFPSAAALLVQIVFGQEIGGFVGDLADMGVSFWVAFLYFATYYMVIVWVCMNLLLVSVLDTFAAETADTDTHGTRLEDFQAFAHCWAALTVGCHAVPFTEKTESIFGKFVNKVTHPTETLLHGGLTNWEDGDDSHVVPEDGAPFNQGTLRMTIEHASGLAHDLIRPYCKVQLQGADKHEAWTLEAETLEGKAMFEEVVGVPLATPDPVTEAVGHTIAMNINQFHDCATIEMFDNYQFIGDFIGRIELTREELQKADKPVTKTIMLQRRADAEPMSPRIAHLASEHWARFETDKTYVHEIVDQYEDIELENEFGEPVGSPGGALSPSALGALSPRGSPRGSQRSASGWGNARALGAVGAIQGSPRKSMRAEDPTADASADPADPENMTKEELKAEKKREKEWKKQEKKRLKAEKKAEKARLKLLKKEEKRRKKLGLSDEDLLSPRKEPVVVREWVDSGVTLQVTFKFEQLNLYVPKMGFLGEYEVMYSHKETNCGVEGWLECSEGGGPFKKQFLYLQQQHGHHAACINIVTNAANGNELEYQASAHKLEIKKIPIESVMNIYADHVYREGDDAHRKGVKNETHIGCEFQIGVDENDENIKTEKSVGHVSGHIVGAENLINVAKGTGETSDPYCVLTLVSTGLLAESHGDGRKRLKTAAVNDDLNPKWNHEFAFDAIVTTTTMLVEVYDKRIAKDLLIGTAEFQVGSDGPGATWTSSSIVSADGSSSVNLEGSEPTTVKIRLTPEEKTKSSSKRDLTAEAEESVAPDEGEDTGAGIVTLEIRYVPKSTAHDVNYLRKIVKDIDDKYSTRKKNKKEEQAQLDELKQSDVAVTAQTRVDYRFRALSPGNQVAWATAIRWLTRGSPELTRPKPIPHASLVVNELVRVSHNVSLLDLPVIRLSRLINGLHKREAVGGHMPTRRWTTYAIFNIEMHSMAPSKKALKRKEPKRRNMNGVYMADLRGLSFHLTLERLAMLHLGKHKCLSYEEQAGEYETEVNSVSLHIIKTVLQWWVNRRRFGQTQGGKKFPKLSIWANNEQLYYRASDAACVARLRSLRVLFSEVRKRKPKDYDAEGGEDPKVVEKKSNPGFFEKRRIKKQEAEKERRRAEKVERLKSEGVEMDVEKIEMVFKKLDVDGSGELDEQEMRLGMQMLMGQMPHKVELEMMEMVDTDKSGTVDLAEFVQGLTTIAMACPESESDDEKEGDSDLDDLDKDVVDLQREFGTAA